VEPEEDMAHGVREVEDVDVVESKVAHVEHMEVGEDAARA
jgi:hypothetical protein